tara:strand:+ start:234 stop:761 length:528 start_codon:yes stop_codon:yes gene_type:complete
MALTTNINFLSPVEFQFALKRLPNVQFFVQTANVPGITSGSTTRATPFKDLDEPGDKLSYDDFTVNIICDEGMETYREISDWLVALTYPKSFDQYASLNPETFGSGGSAINVDGDGIKSDGTLLILNSNKNPSVKVKFSGLFPIAVGSIELNTAGDVTPPTFSVTFKYESYTISV